MATTTAALTDAQLYAQYKATAPALDLRFYLQHTAKVPADGYALLAYVTADDRIVGIGRPEFYRRLRSLQDIWRAEPNQAADRAFVAMRAQQQRTDAVNRFKRDRVAMLDAIGGASVELPTYRAEYATKDAIGQLRAIVRTARQLYPRVFEHEQAA